MFSDDSRPVLPAIDCIQRGLASLRGNWELVLVQVGQSVLVGALALAGLAAPVALAGGDAISFLTPWRWAEAGGTWPDFERWLWAFAGGGRALALALAATAVTWLTAVLAYCAVQAGIFGVLVAADRQAPPGVMRPPEWFRTFSVSHFLGWGGRYLWRFVRFGLVALAATMSWALATALWLGTAAWAASRWGGGALLGFGCGGALPIVFGWAVLWLWLQLAQASLAEGGCGVRSALRRAGGVLGRRVGGVLFVVLVFVVAVFALTLLFTPLRLGFEMAVAGRSLASWGVRLLLTTAQGLIAGMLAIGFAGALVALVRTTSPVGE